MPDGDRVLVIARLRTVAVDERGFSLIEVLISCLILAVMLGAVLAVLDNTNREAPRDQERAEVIEETQVGMSRMTRELRHAYKVDVAGPWAITVHLMRSGVAHEVGYDCAEVDPGRPEYRRCVRWEDGGARRPVIRRVLLVTPNGGGSPPPVFEYTQNAAGRIDYVKATVVVASQGDLRQGYLHKVTLKDGFFLRNVDTCGPQAAAACP